jgi:hypothetical protein
MHSLLMEILKKFRIFAFSFLKQIKLRNQQNQFRINATFFANIETFIQKLYIAYEKA